MKSCNYGVLKIPLITGLTVIATSVSGHAFGQENSEATELEEVIVTGVFKASGRQGATVAVTGISEEELEEKVAFSAADILKDVPGVFVNPALGEIRNIVYTRGISANSLDGNNGYFYVSLQEDGLPVQNAILTNFGPDYFSRPDLMTRRVEALRGGSAAITGPNAPGGTFNYLSKTGLSNPGTEVSVRVGSEGGEFGNPYYRADFFHGGSFNDNLHYGIGGFYRDGTGSRDPGYSTNRGGQLRANLIFEYEAGSVQANVKLLNDHNIWDEFTPVSGFSDARPIGAFDFDSSVNPPRVPHCFPSIAGGGSGGYQQGRLTDEDCWDPADGVHSTSEVLSLTWDHEFADGWSINNKFKYSQNEADWNSGAAIFSMSLDVPGIYGPAPFGNGILAVGVTDPSQPFGFDPFEGVISFRDSETGSLLAQVNSDGNGGYSVLNSSLPDAPELENAVLIQTAFAPETGSDEIINQFTVSKELDNMTFNLGAFYSTSELFWRSGEGGTGLSQFTPNREILDISIERADGRIQQVTSPDGFAGAGRVGAFQNFASYAEQDQFSVFFGHDWQINDRLSLDWGARYEKIEVEGLNQVASQFTDTSGGLDGNPDTLFDNTIQELGAPVRYSRDFDYTAFSAALGYEWNDRHTTYIRIANGEKAPSVAAFVDPGAGVNDGQYIPQTVRQFEIGHTISGQFYDITITPFLSELENIGGFGSPVQFTDIDGTTYVRESLLSSQETFGVELEASIDVSDRFNVRFSGTLQDSESIDNAVWRANNPGRSDDTILQLPDGDAANTAKVQGAITGTYSRDLWSTFITLRHLGDRPANANNTFDLEAFTTIDVGASYKVNDDLTFRLNVNNLTNEHGVLSWQGAGDFNGLDRSFTPVNELWSVVHQQPRAIFFTASIDFD